MVNARNGVRDESRVGPAEGDILNASRSLNDDVSDGHRMLHWSSHSCLPPAVCRLGFLIDDHDEYHIYVYIHIQTTSA